MDSRIEMLSSEEAKRRAAEMELPEALAELNVFRVMLHQPLLAKALSDLLLAQLLRGALDARLRELIIMRIGWATGCDYEWTQHWRIAQERFGCSEDDLLALRDWRASERFGPAERAVLAATDETLASGAISAATWAEVEAAFPSPGERLEVVSAIGTWHLISNVARGIGFPLEEGVASWPPDGIAPTG